MTIKLNQLNPTNMVINPKKIHGICLLFDGHGRWRRKHHQKPSHEKP